MLRKLSIKQKLLFGLGVLLSLFVIVVGFGIFSIFNIQKNYSDILRLKENEISLEDAFKGHLLFRIEVEKFNWDDTIINFHVEKDHRKCKLGKFYYSDIRKELEEKIPELKELFAKIDQPHIELHKSVEYLETLLKQGKREEAKSYYEKKFQTYLNTILELITSVVTILKQKANILEEITKKNIYQSFLFVIIVNIIILFLSSLLGFIFSNRLSHSLIDVSSIVNSSKEELERAGKEISSGSQNLASISSELASGVEEITSSIEELQSIIESNAKNINQSVDMVYEIKNKSEEASQVTENLKNAMESIVIDSKKIDRIIKIIEDIAFQTNILSLNAAVESARAGEAGKGFSVVAEQVKQLASKTSSSIKETSDLIDSIRHHIQNGREQVQLTKENAELFKELANQIYTFLSNVNLSLKEETKGAMQVTNAISQVNAQVQNIASISEENASISEELFRKTSDLKKIIEELNKLTFGEREK